MHSDDEMENEKQRDSPSNCQFSLKEMEVSGILLDLPKLIAESERPSLQTLVWGAKRRRSALDFPPSPRTPPRSSSFHPPPSSKLSLHSDRRSSAVKMDASNGPKKKLRESSLKAEFWIRGPTTPTEERQLPIKIVNQPLSLSDLRMHLMEILENGQHSYCQKSPSLSPGVELNMNPRGIPVLKLPAGASFLGAKRRRSAIDFPPSPPLASSFLHRPSLEPSLHSHRERPTVKMSLPTNGPKKKTLRESSLKAEFSRRGPTPTEESQQQQQQQLPIKIVNQPPSKIHLRMHLPEILSKKSPPLSPGVELNMNPRCIPDLNLPADKSAWLMEYFPTLDLIKRRQPKQER